MKYSLDGINYYDVTVKALDGMPIGAIIGWGGSSSTIPAGWLILDGSTYDDETYPELHEVLGGSGTTFTLPDYRGRVPVGYDSTDTDFNAIAKTGGSKALQQHNHELRTNESSNYLGLVSTAYSGASGWPVSNSAVTTNGGALLDAYTKNAGTGNSGNLQPYVVQYWIIKATQTTPTMASVVNATNNSTEDSYSCNYVNNAIQNVYSTTETKTNKIWINGKPIYRKVIVYDSNTALPNGQTDIPHNVSNIGEYRKVAGKSFIYNGDTFMGYQSSTFNADISSINATNIVVSINGWGNLFRKAFFTIEYTKTTD